MSMPETHPFDFGPDLAAHYAGSALRAARKAVADATAASITAAEKLAAAGRSEAEIARRIGVSRLTVRRWLGRSR